MTGPGSFLCGCSPEQKKNYRTTTRVINGIEILTTEHRDSEGFLVCPEHGARMYGWNSVPTKQREDGTSLPDYSKVGSDRALKLQPVKDRRDNRDPVEVYAERRSRHAGSSNGDASDSLRSRNTQQAGENAYGPFVGDV